MKKKDSSNPRRVSKGVASAPSGSEGLTLLDSVNLFLSLLGGGISIAGLFGSGGPDFTKLFEKLEFEIKQVFLDDLSDAAVRDAAGVAQSASDFFSVDYLDAQNNKQTPGQLWALLNNSMGGRGVGALDAQAGTMEQWAQDNPKAIAQKTTSLALTIHGLLVTYCREMAANAPDPATKATQEENIRKYAQLAVDRITPLYQSVKNSRIGGISDIQSGNFRGFTKIEFVTDAWSPTSDSPAPRLLVVEFWDRIVSPHGPSPDADTQIRAARDAYLRLLGSGTDEDAAALKRALGDAFTGIDNTPDAQGVIDKIPSFQATGRWLAQAPVALQSLRKIAGMSTMRSPVKVRPKRAVHRRK
jgi:hypothetical protein